MPEPTCFPLAPLRAPTGYIDRLFYPMFLRSQIDNSFKNTCYSTLASIFPVNITQYTALPLPHALNDLIARQPEEWKVITYFHQKAHMSIHAMAYRIFQVGFTALSHRIETSTLSARAKFCISNIAMGMPFALVWLLDGPWQFVSMIWVVRTVGDALLPVKMKNFIKELDLISKTRKPTAMGFIQHNACVVIRNVACSMIFFLIVYGREFFHMLSYIPFNHEGKIMRCVSDHSPMTHSLRMPYIVEATTPFSWLISECVWVLGKIVIDGIMILLNQLEIVKDLRDPIEVGLPIRQKRFKALFFVLLFRK